MTHCPHCGAKLPFVTDAFCPECRGELGEGIADLTEPRHADAKPGVPPASGVQRSSNGAAEFGLRLVAYLIDILPITVAVTILLAIAFNLDAVPNRLMGRAAGQGERLEYIRQRQIVRDVSLLVFLVYAIVMDASPFRGTLGKKALGLSVTDDAGRRIGIGRSIGRNLGKLVSFAAFGLGCLWMLWSRERKTWHDMMTDTRVAGPSATIEN